MAGILRSRLISSVISPRNIRFYNNKPYRPGYDEAPEEILASVESLASEAKPTIDPIPTEEASAAAAASAPKKKRSLTFLGFGLAAALTGTAAAAGYATYAYSADEVAEKSKALRAAARYTVGEDASAFEKLQARLYTSAMTVPVKATELYLELRRLIEEHVTEFTEPLSEKLLPDLHPMERGVFTLVLDLNETLVYSDWKRERGWRTFKRPGVDAFLEHLAQFYEIVVYSDQMQMYVDPIIERLDPKGCIRYRLNRSATKYQDGKHYRDLSKLNRDPSKIIYLSGHAQESSLQPENSLQITPWTLETDDTELVDLIPFLEYVASQKPPDIRPIIESYRGHNVGKEFIRRSLEVQRRAQGQKQHNFFSR